MNFLYDIFTCFTHELVSEVTDTSETNYKSAGCFFTDGRYVLAGYQQNKLIPRISGIGGSKHNGETPVDTALRETIEELFDIDYIPTKLIEDIKMNVPPQSIFKNHTYRLITYNFTDIENILNIMNKHSMKSPLYYTFPTNFQELLFHRGVDGDSEISHLALLPFVDHTKSSTFVCPLLLSDMTLLLKK